ncbi:MAG: HNH endonuclease signature motif containing protein [Saprospiraceae bacterium]
MSGRYIPIELKIKILKRANERCEYCQSWMRNAIHTFHIDHVIPLDKEGETEFENLALSCSGCNSAKSTKIAAKDPVSKDMVSLFHPRQQKWEDHFVWSEDFIEMIGLTAVGRATIIHLRLNRIGLKNMRRLTTLAGEHPPID